MRIIPAGSNCNVVEFDNGARLLLSYGVPVAAVVYGQRFQTSVKYSVTTSKHINQWFVNGRAGVPALPAEFFQNLLDNNGRVVSRWFSMVRLPGVDSEVIS
jgi:hypothetical protein